jgi:hypothetical protein
VGKNNYRHFLVFVNFCVASCIVLFALSVVHIHFLKVGEDLTLGKTLKKIPAAPIVIAITLVTFFTVGGLSAFHINLIQHGVCGAPPPPPPPPPPPQP